MNRTGRGHRTFIPYRRNVEFVGCRDAIRPLIDRLVSSPTNALGVPWTRFGLFTIGGADFEDHPGGHDGPAENRSGQGHSSRPVRTKDYRLPVFPFTGRRHGVQRGDRVVAPQGTRGHYQDRSSQRCCGNHYCNPADVSLPLEISPLYCFGPQRFIARAMQVFPRIYGYPKKEISSNPAQRFGYADVLRHHTGTAWRIEPPTFSLRVRRSTD